MDRLQKSPLFQNAIRGVHASFIGLLLFATISFATTTTWSLSAILLAIASFVALRMNVGILWVVIIGGAISAFVL